MDEIEHGQVNQIQVNDEYLVTFEKSCVIIQGIQRFSQIWYQVGNDPAWLKKLIKCCRFGQIKVSLNASASFLELINYKNIKKKSPNQELLKYIFNDEYAKDVYVRNNTEN